MPKHKKQRKTLRRLAMAVILLSILLVAGEFSLRQLYPDLYGITYFQADLKEDHYPQIYIEDADLFWKPVDDFAPEMATANQSNQDLLIYTFGGSISKGVGSPKNFTNIVVSKLADDRIFSTAVNFAELGYTSHQSLVLAQRACRQKSPHFIFLCNVFNDSEPNPMTDLQAVKRNHSFSVVLLYQLNRLKMFILYRKLLLKIRASLYTRAMLAERETDRPRVPLPDYRQNLLSFTQLCRENGCKLILITQHMPIRQNQQQITAHLDTMRDFCSTEKNAYLADVESLFMQFRQEKNIPFMEDLGAEQDELFADSCCHPSLQGHKLYAAAIYRTLTDNKLITPAD